MLSTPRIGYVKRNSKARLHAPRSIPIVIVPGFGGTRLATRKEGKLVWNPLGAPFNGDGIEASPGNFVVDYGQLSAFAEELVPTTHQGETDEDDVINSIVGFGSLIPETYGKLACELAKATFTVGGVTIGTKVYCAGYDWRQDNAKSALRLAATVERALRETGEQQVVLVAHGMGGLLSRYYCRALAGEAKVFAMFLLGSPTLGAPEAFTQLKNGVTGVYVGELATAAATGDFMTAITEGLAALATLPKAIDKASEAYDDAMSGKSGKGLKGLKEKAEGVKEATSVAASGLLGELYMALSMGKGELLSKEESVHFMRQLNSA